MYGGDAISLATKLATAYRREGMLQILYDGGLGLVDVEQTQINPELLQTDWLEVSFVQLSVRVNDVDVDPDIESIEQVDITGELDCTILGEPDENPLEVDIQVGTAS